MVEAVIAEAIRTPVGRRGGSLSDVHPVDLLATVLDELVTRTGIDPSTVDDHIAGCVSQVGDQSLNIGRNAWLAAGLPHRVPSTTVDRQCGSSQQAIHFAAQGVMAGSYDLAVASGIEHMTRVPMYANVADGQPYSERLRSVFDGKLVHQGISAELIAGKWGLTRDEQDDLALRSHERAGDAIRDGRLKDQLVPVPLAEGTLEVDEGVRLEPDRQKMGQLRPAFLEDRYESLFPGQLHWTVTAANASQISDGAAATLITTMATAERLGLEPLATITAMTVVGDDPIFMLTGPIPATRAVLDRASLTLEDIDVVEINEAFASVVLAWKRELQIDDAWFEEHVNPNGGAIAIGHPVGASGARLMTTLVHELRRRDGRYGLQVMCEAGGQANATIVERR